LLSTPSSRILFIEMKNEEEKSMKEAPLSYEETTELLSDWERMFEEEFEKGQPASLLGSKYTYIFRRMFELENDLDGIRSLDVRAQANYLFKFMSIVDEHVAPLKATNLRTQMESSNYEATFQSMKAAYENARKAYWELHPDGNEEDARKEARAVIVGLREGHDRDAQFDFFLKLVRKG